MWQSNWTRESIIQIPYIKTWRKAIDLSLNNKQVCLYLSLRWRHNGHDGVSNHQPHDCLPNRLFRPRSRKTSKLCVTGLCEEFTGDRWIPRTKASNAENISIWWRHHIHICDNSIKRAHVMFRIACLTNLRHRVLEPILTNMDQL